VSKDAKYLTEGTYPSSISRNRCAEPESLDMKTMVPIGIMV